MRNHDISIAISSAFSRFAFALASALALLVVGCGAHDPLSASRSGAGGGAGSGGGGGPGGSGGPGGDGAGQAGASGSGGCAGPPLSCAGSGCPPASVTPVCASGHWICPEGPPVEAPMCAVVAATDGACVSGGGTWASCDPSGSPRWVCPAGMTTIDQCKCYVGQVGTSCGGSVDARPDTNPFPCPGTRLCSYNEYCVTFSGGPAPPCLARGDGGVCPEGTTPGCVSNANGCTMLQPPVGTCVSLANCSFNSLCACLCGVGGAGCNVAGNTVMCGLP